MAILKPVQVAWLELGSRYTKDTVRNGRVIRRGDARTNKALVLEAMRAAVRDQDRARDRKAIAEMQGILASSNHQISHLKPGRARNAGWLNRPRGGAMSMGFYKGSGFGG